MKHMKPTIIDRAVFEELKGTAGDDFVRELVDTFLVEAPAMLKDLRGAYADGDGERFRRVAHSLKSNSNTFGATTLGAKASELELRGIDSARQSKGQVLDALDSEYAEVAKALVELARA